MITRNSAQTQASSKPNGQALRVAGYVRVSSSRQVAEGDSLEAQENAIKTDIKRRVSFGEFELGELAIFKEKGKSAKDQNRPKWKQLRREVCDGKIDMIVVYKLDRVTRSILDFAEVWQFLAKHDVQLISLRENFDTTSAMGKTMLHITLVFAQLERELTGERTRATMEDRASRGLWNGGLVYGYQVGDKGKLVVDPQWAEIIRRHMFDAFEELGSIGAVTGRLRELGIYPPQRTTRSGRKLGGRPFDARQVANILSNRVNLGEVRWGGVVCVDAHEAIINKAQFDRVQRKFGENRRSHTNHRQPTKHDYIVKGLVRCGLCGSIMTPYQSNGRNGRHFYYACTQRLHRTKSECNAPYMPAGLLDKAVVERCIALSVDESARDRVVRAAMDKANDEGRRLDTEIEAVRRRMGQLKNQIGNLLDVLKHLGTKGIDSVRQELQELEEERNRLYDELKPLRQRRTKVCGIGETGQQFLDSWQNVAQLFAHATPEEQRALIRLYVEVIEIKATKEGSRQGTYAMALFPEAVTNRSDPVTEDPRSRGAGHVGEGRLLSSEALVRSELQKAPRVGLEPTT